MWLLRVVTCDPLQGVFVAAGDRPGCRPRYRHSSPGYGLWRMCAVFLRYAAVDLQLPNRSILGQLCTMMLPAAASEKESKGQCSSYIRGTTPHHAPELGLWSKTARTQTPAWLCATLAQSACLVGISKSREVSGKYHSDASVSQSSPSLAEDIDSACTLCSRSRILRDEGLNPSSSHQPHAAL